MLLPKRLQKGSRIGVVAPSKPLSQKNKECYSIAKAYLESIGFETVDGKNLYEVDQYNASAGTPQQRADDINHMFADDSIDAVWFFQGGDTAVQILDLLDYSLIQKNPKLAIGKSDVDVLLLAIHHKTGILCIHGPDIKIGENKELDFEYTKKWFQKRLVDGSLQVEKESEWTAMREGIGEGVLIGCNISSVLKILNTEYLPEIIDAVLFLESYRASADDLLNRLGQLKIRRVFEQVNAIVVGSNFGYTGNVSPEEIIKDLTEEYDIPILKVNNFGHYQPHAFYPVGARIRVDATKKEIEILEPFVQ